MESVKLVKPNVLFKESFLDFVNDVKNSGYESYEHYIKAEKDFDEFIIDEMNASKGINLKKDHVPCSSYWLVDNKEEVIGVIRIRHRVDSDFLLMIGHIGYEIKSNHRRQGYGTKLLKLGLVEARKIGLDKVIITCDENNIGSRRIIEKFNGVYKKTFFDDESKKNVLQYEVKTTVNN